MTEENPFLPPQPGAAERAATPRSVEAGRGVEWLRGGWRIFMKNPGMWAVIALLWVVIFAVLSLIPVLGQLAIYLLAPVFTAGALLACRELEGGAQLRIDFLFAGFKANTGNLILLGLFYLVGAFAVALIAVGIAGGSAISAAMIGDLPGIGMAAGGLMLGLLVALALTVPLAMAFWFAPALVAFRDAQPMEALKASFSACLRNMLPFLIYGILLLVAAVIASVPLMLGWLVLLPVAVASVYVSYVELFD
jgi:uncharacterized membrane protein